MTIEKKQLAVMAAGGEVAPIIPQTLEGVQRIAKVIVASGLAPQSLVPWNASAEQSLAAITVAILFGAELGLAPMVALRSMAVVNGRPALYADGLVNVVRRSGKAAYIKSGYDADRQVGWCKAKRADTGEEAEVEFSLDEARKAGLLVESEFVERYDKKSGVTKKVRNDAPWYRYPQRMAKWRATGWCLRDLFADVLGGATSAEELQDAASPGDIIEVQSQELFSPPPEEPEPASSLETSLDGFKEPDAPESLSSMLHSMVRATDLNEVDFLWSRADMSDWSDEQIGQLSDAYDAAKARIRNAAGGH